MRARLRSPLASARNRRSGSKETQGILLVAATHTGGSRAEGSRHIGCQCHSCDHLEARSPAAARMHLQTHILQITSHMPWPKTSQLMLSAVQIWQQPLHRHRPRCHNPHTGGPLKRTAAWTCARRQCMSRMMHYRCHSLACTGFQYAACTCCQHS